MCCLSHPFLTMYPARFFFQDHDEGGNFHEEDDKVEVFSRRKLASNWDRYEASERKEPDDDMPTQRGTDYHVLLESAGKIWPFISKKLALPTTPVVFSQPLTGETTELPKKLFGNIPMIRCLCLFVCITTKKWSQLASKQRHLLCPLHILVFADTQRYFCVHE